METLILKGKGIIENGELERYNSIRIIHIGNSSSVKYQLITRNPHCDIYIIASKNILSISNNGEFSKKIHLEHTNPSFYVKSSEDAVFIITNVYEDVSVVFNDNTMYKFYSVNDMTYFYPDTIVNGAILTIDELLVSVGVLKNFINISITDILDCKKFMGAKLKRLSIKSVKGVINIQYLVNLLDDGFTLFDLRKVVVELSDFIEKSSKTELTTINDTRCTYSKRVIFPSKLKLINIGGNNEMTTEMMDNLLIDAAASLTEGYISSKSKRTSASDDAVNTMIGKGITVNVTKQ